jgi:hypothetical protein
MEAVMLTNEAAKNAILRRRKHARPAHYGYVPADLHDIVEVLIDRVDKPSPERMLAAAVFGETIIDLQRGPIPGWEDDFTNARRWVRSNLIAHPFYFVPLCQALGIDVDAARKQLLMLPDHCAHVDCYYVAKRRRVTYIPSPLRKNVRGKARIGSRPRRYKPRAA